MVDKIFRSPPNRISICIKIMANLSEDVLILVFRYYLEEPSTMPISLSPVCRRWYNLIKSTPSLSFRTVINVKTHRTIPFLLASNDFLNYISRADFLSPNPNDFPLDIEIRCQIPTAEDHKAVCGLGALEDPEVCSNSPCNYVVVRRKQLKWIFAILADVNANFEKPTLRTVANRLHGCRINRWRSLLIQSDLNFETWNAAPNDGWLLHKLYSAPQLTHLTLLGLTDWYEPHDSFAPNLRSLTIEDAYISKDSRIIFLPYLRSLIWRTNADIDWTCERGICPVEELSLAQGMSEVNLRALSIEFPNLRKLRIKYGACRRLLSQLSKSFDDRKGGNSLVLEEIHLIDISGWMFLKLAKYSIITNARRILLESSVDSGQSNEEEYGKLRRFLEACSPDTEIISVGGEPSRVLATARHVVES